jgi:hypothetical protein
MTVEFQERERQGRASFEQAMVSGLSFPIVALGMKDTFKNISGLVNLLKGWFFLAFLLSVGLFLTVVGSILVGIDYVVSPLLGALSKAKLILTPRVRHSH